MLEAGGLAGRLADEPTHRADHSAYPAERPGDLVSQGPEGCQDRADDPPCDLARPGDGFRDTAPHALEEIEHGQGYGFDLVEVLHDRDDGRCEGADENDDEQGPVRLDPVEYGDEES